MIVDSDLFCINCMWQKEKAGFCTRCGFDERSYNVSPHHIRPRSILNGKYLVGKALGEGGFGITYLGWDLNLDLKVAIKEYYPTGFVTRENTITTSVMPYVGDKTQLFQKGRDQFVNEAKRLAKFYTLPGIVSVKDFFLENGTAYIVMEFVEGETLKQRLARTGGKLPAQEMLEMVRPLIYSLAEVHKAGIIHRDISPDNIMLTKGGGVKLLDFGAAREYGAMDNVNRTILVKPGYAPEEQYRTQGKQGPWTDIYSLCATVYRAITGVTPGESIERLENDAVKSPSQLGVFIAPQQEAALMKGMAVLQQNRYQSVGELAAVLYAKAPVPPIPNPIPGPKKRSRLPIVVGCVATVAAVVLAVVLLNNNGNEEAPISAPAPEISAGAEPVLPIIAPSSTPLENVPGVTPDATNEEDSYEGIYADVVSSVNQRVKEKSGLAVQLEQMVAPENGINFMVYDVYEEDDEESEDKFVVVNLQLQQSEQHNGLSMADYNFMLMGTVSGSESISHQFPVAYSYAGGEVISFPLILATYDPVLVSLYFIVPDDFNKVALADTNFFNGSEAGPLYVYPCEE